jgi:hypothetical protein
MKSYFEERSLFGEKLIIEIEDLLTLESTRKYFYDNLKDVLSSENIFILDEPFSLPASNAKVIKDGKLKINEECFDCVTEKVKPDLEPGRFCDLVEERNKKEV